MKKAEAFVKFIEKAEKLFQHYENDFWKFLWDNRERLVSEIKNGMIRLSEEANNTSKEVQYIYSFFLRYDIILRKYMIYLQAVNERYLFDPQPLEVTVNIDFLFHGIEEYWNSLLKESYQYVWKINEYDVNNFVVQKIVDYHWKISYVLRFMFRKEENQTELLSILNRSIKIVRWGEYRDKGETVFHIQDKDAESKDFMKFLEKSNKSPYIFQCSYFQNTEIKNCIVKDKFMQFVVLKHCILENIQFDESVLTGAYFFQCKFMNCSFKSTVLKLTMFEQCCFQEVNWNDASFYGTFYKDSDVDLTEFDEEQREHVVIGEKEFDEKIFFYGAG